MEKISMRKKLLQINVTANWGSTGRIAEQINLLAQKNGWLTYIAYGRYNNPSQSQLIHVGSDLSVYEHYAEHICLDNDGLASRRATRSLVHIIEGINPDIIHLHNIHDHWLNYKILFEYLNKTDIPIVWTQHDCWCFTGGCGHYSALQCGQWRECCTNNCPFRCKPYSRCLVNHCEQHYLLKKKLFTATRNITFVPVSRWLEGELSKSFLKEKDIRVIHNGVDINVFKPVDVIMTVLEKYGLNGVTYLLGVATTWTAKKGFNDFCRLVGKIPNGVKVVLVGLDKRLCQKAAKYGIVGIARTDKVEELVALYNGASIVMNLSYEESFGLTTVEGFACGTPSVVYNVTASPELVTPDTGIVVEPGDIDGVAKGVEEMLTKGKDSYSKNCRVRAEFHFDKNKKYQEYLDLYNELIGRQAGY